MNFVYQPEIAADITEYVEYISPVKAVKELLEKRGSELAESPIVFPTEQFTSKCTGPEHAEGPRRGQRSLAGSDHRVSQRDEPETAPGPLLAAGAGPALAHRLLRRAHVLHGRNWRCDPALWKRGFTFDWAWSNFADALSGRGEQITRSFFYAGTATLLALLIAYPLAYAIAFRAGRFKLLLLFAVIAPFFTTYLIRTIAWKTILFDDGTVVERPADPRAGAQNGRILATSGAVIAGLTYNFLPFMILPLYANLERLDVRLVEAAKDLYSSSRQALPAR